MNFLLVTTMSAPNKLSSLYFSQLEKAGIPYRVYSNQMTSPNDGNLGNCTREWRRWAEENPCDRLIVTDAWDVLCYGTREQLEEVLTDFPPYPIFAAERNCYPEPHIAKEIEIPGPWSFVNGGMFTSSPEDLYNWCNLIDLHPDTDPSMLMQQWLNRRLREKDPLVKIDWKTKLFYCHFIDRGELEVRDGRPYNTVHGTLPVLHHFNGSWPWEPFLAQMEAYV